MAIDDQERGPEFPIYEDTLTLRRRRSDNKTDKADPHEVRGLEEKNNPEKRTLDTPSPGDDQ